MALQDLEEDSQSLNISQHSTPLGRQEVFIVRERRCEWRCWKLKFKIVFAHLLLGEGKRQRGRTAALDIL
jgi:hypothetical protein